MDGSRRSGRGWLLLWIAVFLLFSAAKAYTDRYNLNPDAISYLDMADRLLEGHSDPLHHPYWSPLYPVTLAAGLKVLGPSPDAEFPALHLVNWVIFAAMAGAFAFLLLRLWENFAGEEPRADRDRRFFPLWSAFSFSLLWLYGSQFLPLSNGNPDALAATFVFLAAGLTCLFWSGTATVVSAALLGVVLAASYFAKAAMLPVAILLLLSIVLLRRDRRTMQLIAISAVVFLLGCLPLIIGISRAQNHLSFGESGPLNYAWSINGLPPQSGWTAADHVGGTPAHGPRVLVDHPRTLEFASPVPGTQPLWYNPVYWYEGANTRFNLRGQLRAMIRDAAFFSDLFTYSLIALAVIAALAMVSRAGRRVRLRLPFLLLWPVLVMGMYALVTLETRYVVPFLLLFFLGCVQMLLSYRRRSAQKAVLLLATLIIAIPAGKEALKAASPVRRSAMKSDVSGNLEAAHQIRALGLQPGESIGAVDTGFYFYFAHIAQLRITAAVYEPEGFWKLDEASQLGVLNAMAKAGVRAVVAARPAEQCAASGLWHPLGSSYVVWLPAR